MCSLFIAYSFFSVVRIGFQLEQYDYFEPEIVQTQFENVTLIKEDNRVSEQTFGIQITFDDPGQGINPATLQQLGKVDGFDYVINNPGVNVMTLAFRPDQSAITIRLSLFPDELAEGSEGFRAGIGSAAAPFTTFQLPSPTTRPRPMPPAFPDTLIRILDTDCKFYYALTTE